MLVNLKGAIYIARSSAQINSRDQDKCIVIWMYYA